MSPDHGAPAKTTVGSISHITMAASGGGTRHVPATAPVGAPVLRALAFAAIPDVIGQIEAVRRVNTGS